MIDPTEERREPEHNEYRAQRLANLKALEEAGHTGFGHAFERSGRLAPLLDAFEEGREVRVAGRIVTTRVMGKVIFAHLQDGTGKLQIYLKKDDLPEEVFHAFRWLDLGDHIGVVGTFFRTRTGEPTVNCRSWTLLSKALLPLPDKWDGLQDVEARYRQRYLDLIANPASRVVFDQRIRLVRFVREFLQARGFVEVETPMLQEQAGGASATPFKTHYNALGCDMYMRIAPELYLKRLLVGGFDKVFEMNRNFRNEGISRQHNPEFTMVEIYEAYGDMGTMKELVRELITGAAMEVRGTLHVGPESQPVDLSDWRTVTYRELIEEAAGADYFTLDEAGHRARAVELGCHIEATWDDTQVTQEIFEKKIERTLINPTFVTRLPAGLVPLAKACTDDPTLVDVFELIIGGREIAPGYNELNDPMVQRERLQRQAEAEGALIDESFLEALEHGMPPAGGMGIGIDRLCMLITGAETIRDVVLFPQLKPRD